MAAITIVVPCFNEEHRIVALEFLGYLKDHPHASFSFVDDGSTDDTAGVLESIQRSCPAQVRVIRLPRNMGKAEAVRQGVLEALEKGPDYVGYWDADLATPLQAIDDFAAILTTRADIEIVFGARVQLLGRDIERFAARHYTGRVFATVVSEMLRLKVYDTQCGAKLFRVGESTRDLFGEPFCTSWIFDVEIIARLIQARRGMDAPQPSDIIYEYPLDQWVDVRGSKLHARDYLRASIDVARLYWRYLR